MKGEILDIETVEELAENKKEIERLKRDKNLKELQFINDMLMMEKEKLLNKEVEDEEI